jgi:hypothetical protein
MIRLGATPETNPPFPNVCWHILAYIGDYWGDPTGPNYPDSWMINYIRRVNSQGGVVSMDVHINEDGTIYPPHLTQLKAIGKALRGR